VYGETSSARINKDIMIRSRFLRPYFGFFLASWLLSGCKPIQEKEEITESREISAHAPKQRVDVSSALRFGDSPDEDMNAPRENPLVWQTPAGWTQRAPTEMRLVNLSFGPKDEGECTVTAIPGGGGGLLANINRWRGQMGQPELTDADVQKLPTKMFLGGAVPFVSVDGDFKGMGAAQDAKTGYRLCGLVLASEQLTLFVKMTGPQAVVEQNMPAFDAFCQSVQFRSKAEKIPTH
jgi:hypothetical protein